MEGWRSLVAPEYEGTKILLEFAKLLLSHLIIGRVVSPMLNCSVPNVGTIFMPRRRLPDELLLSKGTFRVDRHGDPQQKAKVERPEDWSPPQFLDEAASAEWNRVVDLYAQQKVITKAHLMPLAAYCVLASKLTRTPESFTSADHAQLRGYASTFGFTPVDSHRITISAAKDELTERFADIA